MLELAQFYLCIGVALFAIGTCGVLLRSNTIVLLMCIELMLNGANLSLVALSHHFGTADGQLVAFFVLAVAAAEASVGLAIIIAVFRNFYSVRTSETMLLRG